MDAVRQEAVAEEAWEKVVAAEKARVRAVMAKVTGREGRALGAMEMEAVAVAMEVVKGSAETAATERAEAEMQAAVREADVVVRVVRKEVAWAVADRLAVANADRSSGPSTRVPLNTSISRARQRYPPPPHGLHPTMDARVGFLS